MRDRVGDERVGESARDCEEWPVDVPACTAARRSQPRAPRAPSVRAIAVYGKGGELATPSVRTACMWSRRMTTHAAGSLSVVRSAGSVG